jgi:SAM-dependent methyltransferase
MARYDGHADWYDEYASTAPFEELRAAVVERLGAGPGRCLDVGCGTGRALPLLAAAGWTAVGVDVSGDQLELAAARGAEVRQGDAQSLSFADGSFDAAVSILTHTDFDDAHAAFAEIARVLRPGSRFVYAGVHPAFASPFAQALEDGTTLLHPGYRDEGWHTVSRNPDRPGIRSRVGVNHLMLSSLYNAVVAGGFAVTALDEPGERDPPLFLVLSAFRATSTSS